MRRMYSRLKLCFKFAGIHELKSPLSSIYTIRRSLNIAVLTPPTRPSSGIMLAEKPKPRVYPNAFSENKSFGLKRFTDSLIASIGLIVFTPLILLIAFAVWLDSPGNPFFCQVRVGRHGKPFTMFKIRTLYVQHFGINPLEEAPEPYRITRLGKYLRSSKADELPQLFNVLFGQMSIVGPRPDIPIQVQAYSGFQQQRLAVKPGLTGVAQVSGNTRLSWHDRILMDIWYIGNRSCLLDLKIILHTLRVIFLGESLNSDPFNLHANLSPRK